jgi:taurine transport system substrate-binding protein
MKPQVFPKNWLNSMIRRRFFYWTLGILSLGIVFVFAACASGSIGTLTLLGNPAQIRIGYQAIPNAELLVKAMGTAEKAFPNSRVQWKTFESGRDVNMAMSTNALDLGLVDSIGASIGIVNQLPYRIYFIHSVIGDNEALVVKDNIRSLRDLKGKKIAVSFGSTTYFSLLAALEELGLKSNEVTILDMPPSDMLAAWQGDDIDAGFVGQPTLNKMVSARGSILVTAKDLYQKGVLTAEVGVAHKDFINTYPGAVKKYVALLDKAVQFYRDKPQEAAAIMAPELGLSPQSSLKAMKGLVWLKSSEQANAEYLGTAEKPGAFAQVLKDSAAFMKKYGALPMVPELKVFQDGIYSNGLAQ